MYFDNLTIAGILGALAIVVFVILNLRHEEDIDEFSPGSEAQTGTC